jgi:hypothetical protein
MKNIIPFVNILFYGLALKWIHSLHAHDCMCAKDWRQQYMYGFYILALVFNGLLIGRLIKENLLTLVKMLIPFMIVSSIVYAAVALSYVVDLKRTGCSCSGGPQRNLVFWLSLIQTIAIGILLIYASSVIYRTTL